MRGVSAGAEDVLTAAPPPGGGAPRHPLRHALPLPPLRQGVLLRLQSQAPPHAPLHPAEQGVRMRVLLSLLVAKSGFRILDCCECGCGVCYTSAEILIGATLEHL